MKKTNITFKNIYTNKQTDQEALEKIILTYVSKLLYEKRFDKLKK